MTAGTFICCVDLLATKESASVGSAEFEDQLTLFRTYLCQASALMNGDEAFEVKVYGDFAYIQASHVDQFVKFCKKLRADLFSHAVFFKAAISSGNLSASTFSNDMNENRLDSWRISGLEDEDIDFIKERFSCVYFGSDIVKAYLQYENFKGVGYFIDPDLVSRDAASGFSLAEGAKGAVVQSVFFDGRGRSLRPRKFYDIAISQTEKDKFHGFVELFRAAAMKNKEYGRCYVSHLVNYIRSEDFSKSNVQADALISEKKLERLKSQGKAIRRIDLPVEVSGSDIFDFFVSHGTYYTHFKDIPLSDVAFGVLIQKIYEDREVIKSYESSDADEDYVVVKLIQWLSKRSGLREKIFRNETHALSAKVRDHFMKLYVEHTDYVRRLVQLDG
jgi:hypothetical protein